MFNSLVDPLRNFLGSHRCEMYVRQVKIVMRVPSGKCFTVLKIFIRNFFAQIVGSYGILLNKNQVDW